MELAEPFATKFDARNLTLVKTAYWSVLLRKSQVTLGSLVLAANRSFVSGSELTAEEAAEFPKIVGRLEGALTKAFHFDKINYLCLMMVDEHYHFHVIPRYATSREFGGIEWVDACWPKPHSLAALKTDDALLVQLRDHLKQYF